MSLCSGLRWTITSNSCSLNVSEIRLPTTISRFLFDEERLIADFVDFLLLRFLTKLLTEDLPRLFVRPNKIVLDFQKGKAVGPVSYDSKSGEMHEGNKDFDGELSMTLVDARNLTVFYGKLFLLLEAKSPVSFYALGGKKALMSYYIILIK